MAALQSALAGDNAKHPGRTVSVLGANFQEEGVLKQQVFKLQDRLVPTTRPYTVSLLVSSRCFVLTRLSALRKACQRALSTLCGQWRGAEAIRVAGNSAIRYASQLSGW